MKAFYADKPITEASQDKLNRGDFSDRIAHYLLSPSSKDGLVVSINGEWGSGKTSIVNLIKNGIRRETEKVKGKGIKEFFKSDAVMPIIVDYSPWNVTEQNGIINQFLNTLKQNFVSTKVFNTIKNIFNLTTFAFHFAPIPSPIKKAIESVSEAFSDYVDSLCKQDGGLEKYKNEVEDALRKTRFRYLVFIDDLDRLNKKEIKLLIQLVKSICNFSNITYILMFDKKIVSDALTDEQSVGGAKYLEKIVQLEFNVPLIERHVMLEILDNDLSELLDGRISDSDKKDISKYFSLGLCSQLSTIRAEKRYLNNLRFAIDMFDKQIYLPDLLVITYLRLIDEKVYQIILDNQDCLLGTVGYENETDRSNAKNDFINGLKQTTNLDYDRHKYLFGELFPHMFSNLSDQHGEDYRKGRLFIPSHFHKYMNMDYDPEDFSLERVDNLLKFDDSAEALSNVSETLNPKQKRGLLNILVDYCSNLKDKRKFGAVLEYLFKDLSCLETPSGSFMRRKDYYVLRICSSLIKNLEDDAERLLVNAAKNGTDVGALVELSNYCSGTYKNRMFDVSKLSDEAKKEIVETTLNKAIELIDKNIDDSSYDSSMVISFVIQHSDERVSKISKSKDDEWLTSFITKSTYIASSYSTTEGRRFYPYYRMDLMNKALSIDETRINALIAKCSDKKNKQRLIVFKMQMDGRKPEHKDDYGFSMQEIQNYCDEKGIYFTASDDYEG